MPAPTPRDLRLADLHFGLGGWFVLAGVVHAGVAIHGLTGIGSAGGGAIVPFVLACFVLLGVSVGIAAVGSLDLAVARAFTRGAARSGTAAAGLGVVNVLVGAAVLFAHYWDVVYVFDL